jgi:hypothetical protein
MVLNDLRARQSGGSLLFAPSALAGQARQQTPSDFGLMDNDGTGAQPFESTGHLIA